jgi:hypothetical protein
MLLLYVFFKMIEVGIFKNRIDGMAIVGDDY